jgi:hypothetical protein
MRNKEYKEPSIVSGTGAVIWSKFTLGLLATVTLEVVGEVFAHFDAVAVKLHSSMRK